MSTVPAPRQSGGHTYLFHVNDQVWAYWPEDEHFYEAQITHVHVEDRDGRRLYSVRFDDGDVRTQVPPSQLAIKGWCRLCNAERDTVIPRYRLCLDHCSPTLHQKKVRPVGRSRGRPRKRPRLADESIELPAAKKRVLFPASAQDTDESTGDTAIMVAECVLSLEAPAMPVLMPAEQKRASLLQRRQAVADFLRQVAADIAVCETMPLVTSTPRALGPLTSTEAQRLVNWLTDAGYLCVQEQDQGVYRIDFQ